MAYNAKTDWKYDDNITENDVNRWEQGIADAHEMEADINNLQQEFTAHQADFSSYQFGDRPYTSSVSKTYYLDQANGSDENDGESPETAFQSWEKVYSKIPIFIHHSYTVKIIGDYDGRIDLYNIHAHQERFILEGNEEDAEQNTVKITGSSLVPIFIRNATKLTIQHLTIEAPNNTNAISMENTTGAIVNKCIMKHFDEGFYDYPIIWIDNSLARIEECTFESNENGFGGIYANDPSIVLSHNNSGVAGRYGLYARRGSVIAKSGSQPTGTQTDEGTVYGGVIR